MPGTSRSQHKAEAKYNVTTECTFSNSSSSLSSYARHIWCMHGSLYAHLRSHDQWSLIISSLLRGKWFTTGTKSIKMRGMVWAVGCRTRTMQTMSCETSRLRYRWQKLSMLTVVPLWSGPHPSVASSRRRKLIFRNLMARLVLRSSWPCWTPRVVYGLWLPVRSLQDPLSRVHWDEAILRPLLGSTYSWGRKDLCSPYSCWIHKYFWQTGV